MKEEKTKSYCGWVFFYIKPFHYGICIKLILHLHTLPCQVSLEMKLEGKVGSGHTWLVWIKFILIWSIWVWSIFVGFSRPVVQIKLTSLVVPQIHLSIGKCQTKLILEGFFSVGSPNHWKEIYVSQLILDMDKIGREKRSKSHLFQNKFYKILSCGVHFQETHLWILIKSSRFPCCAFFIYVTFGFVMKQIQIRNTN